MWVMITMIFIIKVTKCNFSHRKYQPFVLVRSYHQNLKRLVTALGDYRGRNGYPRKWPDSLNDIQLVVES